jgi:GcrA cell cycle regulator
MRSIGLWVIKFTSRSKIGIKGIAMNQEIKPDETHPSHEDELAPDAAALAAAGLLPVPHPQPIVGPPLRKLAKRRLITTLTLSSSTCKWPIGDPAKADFHYCGQLPQSGRPYCDTHDQMSYQPAPRRRPSGAG